MSSNNEKNNEFEGLWDVNDLGHYLKRSRRWIYRALTIPSDEEGSIPCIRLGGSPRFAPQVIREWAKAGFPPASVIDGTI